MGSVYKYHEATIPKVVMLKENRVAGQVINFLVSNNIGIFDNDGYHFGVEEDSDGWYHVRKAPYHPEVHGDYDSALDRLIDDWQVQLVHAGTFDSGDDFRENLHSQNEHGLLTVFYEGLFASRV